jgi:hypothetical protein
MTATFQDIKRWVKEAKKQKATHLIVAVDTFDHDNYPVFVSEDEDIKERVAHFNGPNMQRIDEVYNMSMDIDKQLSERRAWHI